LTTGNGADTPVGHGRWSYRRLNLVSFNIEILSAAAGTPENNIASLRDGKIADTTQLSQTTSVRVKNHRQK